MDPLTAEALRFGLAIIAGGLVAVVSSILSFRYAQRLQRESEERRDVSLRRALVAEIYENMQRLGGYQPTKPPGVPVIRFAWDAARSLRFAADTFDAVARAYAAGEEVSRVVELIAARALSKGLVLDRNEEARIQAEATRMLTRDAGIAFGCFRDALNALGEPLLRIGTPVIIDGASPSPPRVQGDP